MDFLYNLYTNRGIKMFELREGRSPNEAEMETIRASVRAKVGHADA
jgi:hypothetical protein